MIHNVKILKILCALLCGTVLSLVSAGTVCESMPPAQNTTGAPCKMSIQEIYSKLSETTGKDYLGLEAAFISESDSAKQFLTNAAHPETNHDPLATLMHDAYTAWFTSSKKDIDDTLSYLEQLPAEIAKTPVPVPPPTGVAAQLESDYGQSPANLLALYLAKDVPMPDWQIWATLFYLKSLKQSSTNPALIRFVDNTEKEDWQELALETLKSSKDPQLIQKLSTEANWLGLNKQQLNPSQRNLLKAPLSLLKYFGTHRLTRFTHSL